MGSSENWEELPRELLELIGKYLDNRIDVFRFRSISTSWRSVVSFSHLQSQPISIKLPAPEKSNAISSHFTICRLEDKSKSSACLVKVVECKSSGMLELVNPLITRKPQFSSSSSSSNNNENDDDNGCNKKIVNLLEFRLVEIIKGYSFKFKKLSSAFRIKKVIMCDNNVGILALFKSGKLWYWGFGDERWTHIGNEGSYYDDVMVYKGQYYVIDSLGIISWIDKSMNLVQYAPPLCGFGQLKNMVVSDNEFYVVDCYLEEDGLAVGNPMFDEINNSRRLRKVDIKVYKLDEEWGTWVDVKSLGNRVFVLGKEVCFAINVKDFPGCQGDCIYFVDPRMEDRNVRGKVKQLVGRVFRFDNGSIRTVECFPCYKRLFSPSMNWSLPSSSCP
ncbi:hypothetical protein RDABS01_003510 [Bienertia sinuspersici]